MKYQNANELIGSGSTPNLTQQGDNRQASGWVAAAGAIASVVASIWNNASANRRNKKQQEWSEQMWEKQNAYDSPEATRKRLQEAGLNPALMYGQGSNWANSANPENVEFETPQSPIPENLVGSYLGTREQQINMSATQAQIKATESMANRNDTEALKALSHTKLNKQQFEQLNQLFGGQLESQELQNNHQRLMTQVANQKELRDMISASKSWRQMDEQLEIMILSQAKTNAEIQHLRQLKNKAYEEMRKHRAEAERLESGTPLNPNSGIWSPLNMLYNALTAPRNKGKGFKGTLNPPEEKQKFKGNNPIHLKY